ncbi:hypothetical protein P40081_26205 [Paenibacillus sp. FSL P4-0081]|uniref:hypothetical protein n=1 Tax=Paenibacillus sp. FSL P4-0081 TaxID=1536769 RepID=UPI0004F6F3B8|nr:hypothetical protein [Paenibacillus sp. FSL P4-0081]AIQ31267.1 hypothetical protein P40081_26205 [Paenibacillus sp. FSL P4-0081]
MKGITVLLVLITVLITAGCSDTYEKSDTDAAGRDLMLAETTQYLFNYEHNSKDTSSESAEFINECLDIYSGDDLEDYKLLVSYIEMDDIEHVKELQRKLGGDIIE